MAYERPAWAGGSEVPQNMPPQKNVLIDVGEFIRTRDALTAAYLGLSASLDRAVKAYLDHTQVVLAGDASLNVSHLIQPFNVLTNHAQMAQMALGQSNGVGVVAPVMIANGGPVGSEEPTDGKKKRKKRAYKARDPNAPKRPLTAYFRFLGENRASIAAEIQANPELFSASGKPGDISRVATERWNQLNPDQREPYKAAYQAALKEYEKEVEKYKASGGKAEDLDDTKVDESLIEPGTLAGAEQSDTDDEEEEEVAAPPPPPPVKSPKKTTKKAKQPQPTTVAPSQIFSSIDPDNLVADPPPAPVAPMASASKKRGAAADGEGAAKKRSRKSGAAQEAVVAAADPAPVETPVPVAPMAPSSPETAGKKKKEKKKKKGDA